MFPSKGDCRLTPRFGERKQQRSPFPPAIIIPKMRESRHDSLLLCQKDVLRLCKEYPCHLLYVRPQRTIVPQFLYQRHVPATNSLHGGGVLNRLRTPNHVQHVCLAILFGGAANTARDRLCCDSRQVHILTEGIEFTNTREELVQMDLETFPCTRHHSQQA